MAQDPSEGVVRSLSDVIAAVGASDDHHLYSSLAPVYAFVYDRHFDYADQLSVVQEAVPDDTSRVLEIGCGHGRLLALLDDEFDHVVGVDLNEEMIEIAADVAPGADVVTADAGTVCFEAGFDAVVMLGRVLPHVQTDVTAGDVFANCYDRLAPGGVVVFDTFDRRGIEDGHGIEEAYASDDYRVSRTLSAFVNDPDTGRWGFTATYTITDRESGATATAEETMHLRAHLPGELESALSDVGFSDVSFVREGDVSLRAVARRPPA